MAATDREALLAAWVKPSSDTEKDHQNRAERMVTNAIRDWPGFSDVRLKIYTKGSYPNNTNARSDSDVDVVVECHECAYSEDDPSGTGTLARVARCHVERQDTRLSVDNAPGAPAHDR
jgi:tRNA nucleotidyltransferase (CCA-adding enzyme)